MIFAASNALFAASSLLLLAPSPVNAITYNASTHVDCYSSLPSDFIDNGTWTYQSSGYCQEQCVPLGYSVMAMTKGNDCWCGNELPANSTKTDTCTETCVGWQGDACKHLPKPMKYNVKLATDNCYRWRKGCIRCLSDWVEIECTNCRWFQHQHH